MNTIVKPANMLIGTSAAYPCKFVICIFLLFIMSLSSHLYAQQPPTPATSSAIKPGQHIKFEHLSVEHGLSHSGVLCILQDSKGFLWFGTADGLNRYDGYTFRVYKHDPEDPHSWSKNLVESIYEDRSGELWIGTADGLNRFKHDTEQFIHYRHNPEDPYSLSSDSIVTIYEDRSGVLWIGTSGGGLNQFDRDTEQFVHYQHDAKNPYSLSNNRVLSLHEDRFGTLWIGTREGFNKLNRTTGQFAHYKNDPNDPHSLSDNSVFSIHEDPTGELWVGTWGGVNRFDRTTEQFIRYQHDPADPHSLSSDLVMTIYEDPSGALWIGTKNGLNQFDRETAQFIRYDDYTLDRPHSVSAKMVWSLYKDRSGVLWIGTSDGLYKAIHTKPFFYYYHDPHDPSSLSHDGVSLIYEDRSEVLWIGAFDGLNRFDRAMEQFTRYQHDPNDPHSLSASVIWAIYEDRRGNLWIGTSPGGLNRFDRTTQQFTRYQHDPENPHSLINSKYVRVIYEDHAGMLWIGTDSGLDRFVQDTEQFTHYVHDKYIVSIYEDHAGNLWIGTTEGVYRFERDTEQFIHYQTDPNDSHSLSHDDISVIYEDHVKRLWIGTQNGLNTFERETDHFIHYKSLDNAQIRAIHEDRTGILWVETFDDLCRFDSSKGEFIRYPFLDKHLVTRPIYYGILEDDQGNLWFSTNKGIAKFDPQTAQFRSYDTRDGLQNYNHFAWYQTKRGEMLFGGDGLTIFEPEHITDNPHIPPIVFTDFHISYKPVNIGEDAPLKKSISEAKTITLSYKQNVFSFEFAALDYTLPEKNQYAYMLEGFDKEWVYSGTRRFASYTNLPGGTYTFRVKGSNNDGVWNEDGAAIRIIITPPPWKTWWAYTLYVLAAGGAIFGYVRYKTRQQAEEIARQRKELEQERKRVEQERLVSERLRRVDQLKDDFLANVSHELRTPLHGMIGLTESLRDGVAGKPTEKMAQNFSMIISAGRRLASLVNDILDFSKLKKHELTLQRKPLDLRTLTEVVLTVSQPLVAGKDVILKNAISPDLPPVDGDENRVQQILYNLVGNAIKFTERGEIIVSAERTPPWPPSRGEFTHPLPLPGGEHPPLPLPGGEFKGDSPLEGGQGGVLSISVSDTGIGIPQEKLENIFTSFEQADTSIAREYGGTGLGLPVTKQLVELHGGTIWVESEVGNGSTFTFTLSVAEGTAEATTYQPELAKIQEPSGVQTSVCNTEEQTEVCTPAREVPGFRILVVDDEPINQQVLANHLASGKYAITQALNGEEALQSLEREGKFDLVLLDIMMPRMSGYEVCQKIRATYPRNELPVIMVTAKNQVADLVEGFSSGANDYLAKPFSKDELLARIRTHLDLLNINTAYSRFVPNEFLRTLGRESILDVHLGDQIQGTMTVLFSDIRSFTTISEGMTPQENFTFLNDYLKQVIPPIRVNRGFIDKYIGDAVMAIFPDTPEDAVKAAIGMLRELEAYTRQGKLTFALRNRRRLAHGNAHAWHDWG